MAPSTIAPTTMASPADVAAALCTTLTGPGFETRRAALADFPAAYVEAGGTGDGRQAAINSCGEAIERVEAANAIIDRNDFGTVDPDTGELVGELPFEVDDFGCDPESFRGTVTNTGTWPLGVTVFSQFRNGADEVIRTSDAPEVIWSLAPGDTATVTGPHTEIRGAYITCSVNFLLFDADPSGADSSLGVAERPELSGDDPAVWLPALLELTQETFGTLETDVMGEVYDIRSGKFTGLSRDFLATRSPRAIGPVTLCPTGRVQPDPDHLGLLWEEDRPEHVIEGDNGPEAVPAGIVLYSGTFRRGSDGQWRWLGGDEEILAASGTGCDSVGSASGG